MPEGWLFARNREKKLDARAEVEEALKAGILPCTQLRVLGTPPRDKLLGDWFFEGDLKFIFAPRGIGKTWLARNLSGNHTASASMNAIRSPRATEIPALREALIPRFACCGWSM